MDRWDVNWGKMHCREFIVKKLEFIFTNGEDCTCKCWAKILFCICNAKEKLLVCNILQKLKTFYNFS
jgi:hypothetical protein